MRFLDQVARPLGIALTILFVSVAIYSQPPSPSLPPIVVQMQQPSKSFWDYLLIVIQVGTLVGLLLYVYKTWQIASATREAAELSRKSTQLSQKSIELSQQVLEEMRAARGQEIAAQVLAYVDMPYGNWVLLFVVKNGRTLARDIKFDFHPELQSGWGNRAHEFDISFLKNGISSLAPGQELRVVFDAMSNYFDGSGVKLLEGSLPSAYTVRVTYRGGLLPDEFHSTEQVIDLSMFKDIGVLQEKGEKDLIKAIESLAQSSERMRGSLREIAFNVVNGIWVRNPAFLVEMPTRTMEEWCFAVLAKLDEFKILWESVYAGNYMRPLELYIENLQAKISLLSAQILILTARAPQGVPSATKDSLTHLTIKLSVLSEARFLMNGEVSEPDFNSTGDEASRLASLIIENLQNITSLGRPVEPDNTAAENSD